MFWVYALYNKEADKIYIGQTGNLEKRTLEHNKKLGKHFTAQVTGEWKLVYQEKVESRYQALIREKQLKSSRGRSYIKNLINNPR